MWCKILLLAVLVFEIQSAHAGACKKFANAWLQGSNSQTGHFSAAGADGKMGDLPQLTWIENDLVGTTPYVRTTTLVEKGESCELQQVQTKIAGGAQKTTTAFAKCGEYQEAFADLSSRKPEVELSQKLAKIIDEKIMNDADPVDRAISSEGDGYKNGDYSPELAASYYANMQKADEEQKAQIENLDTKVKRLRDEMQLVSFPKEFGLENACDIFKQLKISNSARLSSSSLNVAPRAYETERDNTYVKEPRAGNSK